MQTSVGSTGGPESAASDRPSTQPSLRAEAVTNETEN